MHILSIAIKSPLRQTFSYYSKDKLDIGVRVRVNFAGRNVVGIVWGYQEESKFKLKNILEVLDQTPIFNQEIIELINFCANYYLQPIGEVIFSALPKKLRDGGEKIIKQTVKEKKQQEHNLELTPEQQKAINVIKNSIDSYQAFLLYGITGSGKTEVYLQIAKDIIKKGKQVLVLVPEIGLTPQMINRFASRLQAKVGVYHSALNNTKKLDNYLAAKEGYCEVILATRSGLWVPFKNLGLIIVDEEHDNSFKQNSSPRYNAKNLAFVLAKKTNIPIIFGTATPSTTILKTLIDKKITQLTLSTRASGSLPNIEVIPTLNEGSLLSNYLIKNIRKHINNNEQVMLFINRRGYAPIYYCTSCSHKQKCLSCDKELIYHYSSNKLVCHICDKNYSPDIPCQNCGAKTMTILGYGTQRIEQNLEAEFKGIDIIRIDKDSTTKKNEFEAKIKQINSGKSCIIIGTQMLAKGHDFKNVTMVGVLDIDYALLSTNFRATEEFMQLITQVAGRAGRGENQDKNKSAKVLLQTNYPENNIFQYIKSHNYGLFIKNLLKQREKASMPPFSHQALVVANSTNENVALEYLAKIKQILERLNKDNSIISNIMPSIIPKKSDYYYYEIIIYNKNYNYLNNLLRNLLNNQPKISNKLRFYLDVDPL